LTCTIGRVTVTALSDESYELREPLCTDIGSSSGSGIRLFISRRHSVRDSVAATGEFEVIGR
jgi:hypothetical protein